MFPSMAKPNQASESPKNFGDVAPPGLGLLALEFRAFAEFGAVLPAWPALQRAPRGDGHTVVVYPGLSASDTSTVPLRKYLSSLGYNTHGWGQGFNFGPRAGVLSTGRQHLRSLLERFKQPISLVGWSLGGIYARELAKELINEGLPVRGVISLGTPFAGGPQSTNAWRLYELASGRSAHRESEKFDLATAPSAPTSSIYSRSDGIVAWQASIQAAQDCNPHIENIEVIASHFGIGLNPSAWWAVADRLAQAPGRWQQFQKPSMMGLQNLVFPDPKRV
jgi:pimeloyl-ACP methyl ester carboxylesterase